LSNAKKTPTVRIRPKSLDQLTSKTAFFNLYEAAKILRDELHSAASTFGARSRNAAWQKMHERTGLSIPTIYNIANTKTRYPRWSTVTILLNYFGFQLQLVKTGAGLGAVVTAPAAVKDETKPVANNVIKLEPKKAKTAVAKAAKKGKEKTVAKKATAAVKRSKAV
jgi:hypothetical protein